MTRDDDNELIKYIGIFILIIIGIAIPATYIHKNSSMETLTVDGVVIDKIHSINYIDTPIMQGGKVIGYDHKREDHYYIKVKVPKDEETFTEDSYVAYDELKENQEIKVIKRMHYFKKKYVYTDYCIKLEDRIDNE